MALLLMDESAGRAVAQGFGLQVAETAAVIGMAKLRGLIPAGLRNRKETPKARWTGLPPMLRRSILKT
jgi:hypothetical protein